MLKISKTYLIISHSAISHNTTVPWHNTWKSLLLFYFFLRIVSRKTCMWFNCNMCLCLLHPITGSLTVFTLLLLDLRSIYNLYVYESCYPFVLMPYVEYPFAFCGDRNLKKKCFFALLYPFVCMNNQEDRNLSFYCFISFASHTVKSNWKSLLSFKSRWI